MKGRVVSSPGCRFPDWAASVVVVIIEVVCWQAGFGLCPGAGIKIAGVGLPGHFIVGHFGTDPPVLLDPFAGGGRVQTDAAPELVRPWRAHEVAMRILNNLVLAYDRRGDVGAAIQAARSRLALPAEASHRDMLHAHLRAIQARLN